MVNDNIKDNEMLETDMKYIYNCYYNRVFQDAYFVVRDLHLAQDITQETFMKAFRQIATLKNKDKIGAWLSTIAVRTAIDFIRKESRNETTNYDEKIPGKHERCEISSSVEESVEANFISEEIIQVMMELKKDHREILILRYIHDLSQNEIAAWTNLNIGTVKSRLHRAKRLLKMKLMKDRMISREAFRKWLFIL